MFVRWRAATILANLRGFLPRRPSHSVALRPLGTRRYKTDDPGVVPETAEDQYRLRRDGEGGQGPCHPAGLQMAGHGSFAALADVISPTDNNKRGRRERQRVADCHSNIIVTEEKGHLIAAIGAARHRHRPTPDATLVCHVSQPLERAQDPA